MGVKRMDEYRMDRRLLMVDVSEGRARGLDVLGQQRDDGEQIWEG